ncbi:uncharacterized protein LOC125299746 isoform X1 [Alosa alosa]|uniref:uncharacterized protein LOC125299746 isoform X1 n=2 Tax=Alosa alosa TaxID=278164 RepID=UPI0020150F0C|nr:uncharacterized protein LOC125299746 isoform X1 [Alosa alosa]
MAYYESSDETNPCQATPMSFRHRGTDRDDEEDDCIQFNEGYDSYDNSYSQQMAPSAHQRMEPCRFYNRGRCRNGDNCSYLHVCRFSWIGSCRYGNSCQLRHVGDSDSDDTGRRSDITEGRRKRSAGTRTNRNSRETPSSSDQLKNGQLFKWQLNGGQGWMDIANDLILEAHYSKPYTGGITLHNTPWGAISIDFQLLQVRHRRDVQVRRLSSPHTVWSWFFKSDEGWSQYGDTDTQGRCSKVNSATLESEYQKNQQGSYQFKFSLYTYQITFRDMHQENVSTGVRRQVRRRPCYPATQSPVQGNAALPQSQAVLTRSMSAMSLLGLSSAPKWQFSGAGSRWHDYQYRVGTNLECSTDSVLIEAEYLKNPQGSMTFTVSGQSYLLDFASFSWRCSVEMCKCGCANFQL